MGRITVPFRAEFNEVLERLRKTFYEALVDPERREAFDELVKTWSETKGAMSYAELPSVLLSLLFSAVVDNRKEIMLIKKKLLEGRETDEGVGNPELR
ncbi:MAG: hypothetical protein ACUVXA_08540 [Candidatus Jordarchaeum sp.]|uniref:hypothetical protein n=1 Tax=Candidatus Jordarchaeum sp. TaxID=2823881 RepID=UPI0040492736